MKCPECGAEVGEQVTFCPGCGRQVRAAPHPSGYLGPSHAAPGHKAKGEKSLVLLLVLTVVLMILLPLALLLILYVGILGFGPTDAQPVTTNLSSVPEAGGYKFTFGEFTVETGWDDITIALSDGSMSVSWNPASSLLEGAQPSVHAFAAVVLGEVTLFCNVTDLAGNGIVDEGDYFTLAAGAATPFKTGLSYTAMVVHEPTGALSASLTFSS